MSTFLICLFSIMLGASLAIAWRFLQAEGAFERVLKDTELRLLSLTVIGLVVGVGASIYLIMLVASKSVTDAGVTAMIGTANGFILNATVAGPWGYWFGSSAGSARKTEIIGKD